MLLVQLSQELIWASAPLASLWGSSDEDEERGSAATLGSESEDAEGQSFDEIERPERESQASRYQP